MQIFINPPSNRAFILDVHIQDTVSSIKTKIRDQDKTLSFCEFELCLADEKLDDSTKVYHFNVSKSSYLEVETISVGQEDPNTA